MGAEDAEGSRGSGDSMSDSKIERSRKLRNIPEYGAVARVTGGSESRAVIHTADGEIFRASCTMGPYWAMKAAMDKWRESEKKRLDELVGG